MPDITMCSGMGCPLKGNCYRATAEPNKWRQSYFANPPIVYVDGEPECDHQWKLNEKKGI